MHALGSKAKAMELLGIRELSSARGLWLAEEKLLEIRKLACGRGTPGGWEVANCYC
jgi:hypothetical protein